MLGLKKLFSWYAQLEKNAQLVENVSVEMPSWRKMSRRNAQLEKKSLNRQSVDVEYVPLIWANCTVEKQCPVAKTCLVAVDMATRKNI